MKLKKYNNFLIKESFTSSDEYYDYLTKNQVGKDLFFDNLLEVTDIPGIKTHYYTSVIDSEGHLLNDKVEPNGKYRIQYTVMIDYWFMIPDKHNFSKFSNQLEQLNTIKNSIDEMIDRVSDKVKLDKNEVTSTGKFIFVIGFTQEIDNNELLNAYDEWEKYTGPEYQAGIERLRKIYKNAQSYVVGAGPIDLDKHIDTNTGDGYILIGFFGDDEELYGIAQFDKETKRFVIDKEEIIDSIRGHYDLR